MFDFSILHDFGRYLPGAALITLLDFSSVERRIFNSNITKTLVSIGDSALKTRLGGHFAELMKKLGFTGPATRREKIKVLKKVQKKVEKEIEKLKEQQAQTATGTISTAYQSTTRSK